MYLSMKPTLKTSLLKLILVGILFYTSYGLSNHYAASLDYVPEIAFCMGEQYSVLGMDDCALLVAEPDVCRGIFSLS